MDLYDAEVDVLSLQYQQIDGKFSPFIELLPVEAVNENDGFVYCFGRRLSLPSAAAADGRTDGTARLPRFIGGGDGNIPAWRLDPGGSPALGFDMIVRATRGSQRTLD